MSQILPTSPHKHFEDIKKTGQSPKYHFADASKKIIIAKGSPKQTIRIIENFKLSRYGCYSERDARDIWPLRFARRTENQWPYLIAHAN